MSALKLYPLVEVTVTSRRNPVTTRFWWNQRKSRNRFIRYQVKLFGKDKVTIRLLYRRHIEQEGIPLP